MRRETPQEFEQLSYRELADRLSVSTDEARLLAYRRAKSGEWRIIHGNHTSDPVLVEVPVESHVQQNAGLPRVWKSHATHVQAEQPLRMHADHSGEQANALAGRVMAGLLEATTRIHHLTDQLMDAKETQRVDAVARAAAETREQSTQRELERALLHIANLQRQLKRHKRSWWRRFLSD